MTDNLWALLERCWAQEANERPMMTEVLITIRAIGGLPDTTSSRSANANTRMVPRLPTVGGSRIRSKSDKFDHSMNDENERSRLEFERMLNALPPPPTHTAPLVIENIPDMEPSENTPIAPVPSLQDANVNAANAVDMGEWDVVSDSGASERTTLRFSSPTMGSMSELSDLGDDDNDDALLDTVIAIDEEDFGVQTRSGGSEGTSRELGQHALQTLEDGTPILFFGIALTHLIAPIVQYH